MDFFVTPEWLKINLPVNKNVDNANVVPLIKATADMWVRSILGTFFYNDLLTKYNNQTLSTDEKTLVNDYIKYAVGWKASSEIILTTSYELKNKGIQTQSGDFSANAEFKEINFMVHHYSDKADFYENRLSVYLKDNKDLYPNFISDSNTDSTVKKNLCNDSGSNFTTNILFI